MEEDPKQETESAKSDAGKIRLEVVLGQAERREGRPWIVWGIWWTLAALCSWAPSHQFSMDSQGS